MPIPLRPDFDASGLRFLARESKDANQVRRLLPLAAVYDGATRTEAAEFGGVTLQIIRDWVLLKFNACGPDGLIDRKVPGQPPRLNATHRAALAAAIESGPIPAMHGVVRWRIIDLCQRLVGRVPGQRLQADARPRAACDGISQAVGAFAPSWAGGETRSTVLKKLRRRSGRHRAQQGRQSQQHRNLVRRSGPCRPEKQDHQASRASLRDTRSPISTTVPIVRVAAAVRRLANRHRVVAKGGAP